MTKELWFFIINIMGNIDNIPNMLLKERYTNYTKNQKSK